MASTMGLGPSCSSPCLQTRSPTTRAARPAPSRCTTHRRTLHVSAALWTPPQRDVLQPSHSDRSAKGWDRPWSAPVQANQSVIAPRTGEMQGDPFSMLLRQRIVFLGGEVEDFAADALISQLLLLDSQDPTKDIKLFINSPGGSVTAGMGIYDAMQLCQADVQTYCFGLAASMGAFLLGAGKKGKRYSMANSRIMIHQPLGGASGQAVDIEIQAKEIMYHKANLNRIMADCTGQPLNKIEEDTDRDRYMSPLEAKAYGIIDHIVGGDEGVFALAGSTRRFPKVKDEFVTDKQDLSKRSVMDGDSFLADGRNSWRFNSPDVEPYVPSLAPDTPWFKTKRVGMDEYKELLDKRQAELESEAAAAPPAEKADGPPKRSPKDRIDRW